MDSKYEKCINKWNDIFGTQVTDAPVKTTSGIESLDKGIQWLCHGTEKVLDFGCGNGTMLFLCGLNGTQDHIGIDLSENGIIVAKEKAKQMKKGEFHFMHGGIERLNDIESLTMDAVILSNIIDNLYPNDAERLINEVERILRDRGKVLVKLNAYITTEQIAKQHIKVIEDNLLDDGFLLWNKTTDEWMKFFERKFHIQHYEEIYFQQFDQYNRMFWLVK